jgi:hypothetical protein
MAFNGFRYDRGRGMLGFDFKLPQETQNTFWSLGDVWGNYEETSQYGRLTARAGVMKLAELHLEKVVKEIRWNGDRIPFRIQSDGTVQLEIAVMLAPETPVEMVF